MEFPYLAHSEKDKEEMLKSIGVDSIESLFSDIPGEIFLKKLLSLPLPVSELEIMSISKELAGKNADAESYVSFLGGGAYDHFIPSVVKHITSRSEFYTAYTPYQFEISQGVLQVFYEYQSLICELTGMDVSNASMYDGASALAEACIMAYHASEKRVILISRTVNPVYRQVLKTYTKNLNVEIKEIPHLNGTLDIDKFKSSLNDKILAVVIQHPNFFGFLEDVNLIGELAKKTGAAYISAVDPVSLALLSAPSEYGADIAVGEGQSLGNSVSFGGPYVGFLACKNEYLRKIPGRIIGMTKDTKGRRGFVLTLQAREQHIRREKATSNICSNEALCALATTVYLSTLGKNGLKKAADLCLQKAHYAASNISKINGFSLMSKAPFFKEFTVQTSVNSTDIINKLLNKKIIAGLDLEKFDENLKKHLLICVTEKRTRQQIDSFVKELTMI